MFVNVSEQVFNFPPIYEEIGGKIKAKYTFFKFLVGIILSLSMVSQPFGHVDNTHKIVKPQNFISNKKSVKTYSIIAKEVTFLHILGFR